MDNLTNVPPKLGPSVDICDTKIQKFGIQNINVKTLSGEVTSEPFYIFFEPFKLTINLAESNNL